MSKVGFLLYGVVCYAIFFGSFLYAIGFLGNVLVPKGIDDGPEAPMSQALIVNILLLSVFALPHSVMARPGFKERWTKICPKPIERSTYVVVSALLLILLFWQWRPIPATVWDVSGSAFATPLWMLFGLGWGLVLYATFLIDHFDLFGLRQVFLHWQGKEYTSKPFKLPGMYKMIRHPLYLGWFTTFWATPTMTQGHLLFAVVASAYILVAIQFEERDLVEHFGDQYREYQKSTPMVIPIPKRGGGGSD